MANRERSAEGLYLQTLPTPAALTNAASAQRLRDMQGLAARFFGGRSAAEPGVARTEAAQCFFCRQPLLFFGTHISPLATRIHHS